LCKTLLMILRCFIVSGFYHYRGDGKGLSANSRGRGAAGTLADQQTHAHRVDGGVKGRLGTEGRHGSDGAAACPVAGPMQQAVRDSLIGLMAAHRSGREGRTTMVTNDDLVRFTRGVRSYEDRGRVDDGV